jgi:hypothetical protein
MAADVRIGQSARTSSGVPHLLVRVLDREVLACTGGISSSPTSVSVEDAAGQIECGSCRKFWKAVAKAKLGL